MIRFVLVFLATLALASPSWAARCYPTACPGAGGGHIIEDTDVDILPQRAELNFTGAITCTDDAVNAETDCNIPGGAFDSTTVEATTWGAGGNASNIWTFDVAGTDWTATIGNGLMTFGDSVTVTDILTISNDLVLNQGAIVDQPFNNQVVITENLDNIQFTFGGAFTDMQISEGPFQIRGGTDLENPFIVNIDGYDAGERGELRVRSDGDDHYIALYHDDTDAIITTDTAAISFADKDLDDVGNIALDTLTADTAIITVNAPLHIGGDDAIQSLLLHDGSILTMYDDSDDTSVTLVVTDGTDNLALTGDLDVSGAITGAWDPEAETVTNIADMEILMGVGAGDADYLAVTACAADAKPEFADAAPNTFTCEQISGLVDADISNTLTASIIDLEAGTVTNIADKEIIIGVGAGDASYVAVTGAIAITNAGVTTIEVNGVDTITDIATGLKSGEDLTLLTGTATNGQCGQFNVDGDLVGSGGACGGTGAFTDADPIVQNTTTFDVHMGDAAGTLAGKVEIGGDADQPQLVIEGHSTQTDSVVVVQNDADTQVVNIDVDGNIKAQSIEDIDGPGTLWEITALGAATFSALGITPSATPTIDFIDSDTAGDNSVSIDVECSDAGAGTEDCDLALVQQRAGGEVNIMVADADAGITFGHAATTALTVVTAAGGDAAVVLPVGAIGTADILDDAITATDLAATITFADGDLVDFSATDPNATAKGLIIPTHATDCQSITDEGQVCWEEDAQLLWIGDGTGGPTSIVGTGDVASVGDCLSGTCLDGGLNDGTYIRIYDGDSHYVELNPSDITANRTVAFRDAAGTVIVSGYATTGDVTGTYETDASHVTTIAADVVDDTMINWGAGAGQVDYADIPATGAISTAGTAATGALTVTGVINTSVGLDGVGAVDMDYGSADITDHTFIADGGNVILDGTVSVAVGLDGIGAVDMDYGSADITDHTFTTDGTGDAEIVLPNDSIGDAEIAFDEVTGADLTLTDAGAITSSGTITAAVGFDITGAADIDYGSADVLDHTFVSDGGTVVIDGIVTAEVGYDCTGAADCDFGSADILDFSFTTDGTGDQEVLLPADSIGATEIDSTTGAYDFGGVSSLEIPNGLNPTVDADGEIAYDTDDENLRVFDGTQDRAINTYYDKDFMIFEPDQVNDLMCIFKADALLYPFGITVTQIAIWLPADAAYSMVFEEWAGDPLAAENDMDTVTTGAGDSYMEDAALTDGAIDADDYICLDIPATDVDWVAGKIIFYVNPGA